MFYTIIINFVCITDTLSFILWIIYNRLCRGCMMINDMIMLKRLQNLLGYNNIHNHSITIVLIMTKL